jgi:hypothetical protein
VLPTIALFIVFHIFDVLPFLSALFSAFAVFMAMQLFVMKVVLAHDSNDNPVASSPHFASIIIASMVWVFYAWATRLINGEQLYGRGLIGQEHRGMLSRTSVSSSVSLFASIISSSQCARTPVIYQQRQVMQKSNM